jgi:hypothetical protein
VAPDWSALWAQVAETTARHAAAGRGHLLTEDVVRFATALELERQGIAPGRLRTEYRVPELGGSIDLVIDDPPIAAIEFKFPRDPRAFNAADTMTVGELLKDFYRMDRFGVADAWVVQLLGDRLLHHLSRRSELAWATDCGDMLMLTRRKSG